MHKAAGCELHRAGFNVLSAAQTPQKKKKKNHVSKMK